MALIGLRSPLQEPSAKLEFLEAFITRFSSSSSLLRHSDRRRRAALRRGAATQSFDTVAVAGAWYRILAVRDRSARLRRQLHSDCCIGRRLRIPHWASRLITRAIAIIPVLVATPLYGDQGTGGLLGFSQVILSMQLPF